MENKKIKTRGHIKNITLSKAFEMFEEPEIEENAIVYLCSEDLNNWLEKNIV